MDTLTHAALGASIGEIVLGKKIGNKAALWGAIAANLPDLDLLSRLFVGRFDALIFHRGPTHSLVFCLITAAIVGYFLHRRLGQANFQQWSWLVFLGLLSHVFLDCCNSVGIQLLYPFSSAPISFGNIFYIDPLYTGLLLVGLFFSLRLAKNERQRFWDNSLGLFLSSLYLIFTFTNQAVANAVFTNALHLQGKSVQRKLTLPTPFNTFMWYTVAEGPTGYHLGYYHILDDSYEVSFDFLPKETQLDTLIQSPELKEKVQQLTQGYLVREVEDDQLYYRDLLCGISLPTFEEQNPPDYYLSYVFDAEDPTPQVRTLPVSTIWQSLSNTWSTLLAGKIPD